MKEPVRVSPASSSSDLESPKSPTLTRPSASRKQFDGFTSRWITPWMCSLLQPVDDVEHLGDRLAHRQGAAAVDQGLQRLAGHQLHDDVGAALVLVGREHEHATRVRDGAGQAPLLAEPLDGLGRRGVRRGDELQRHAAAQRGVLGLVHRAHAPRPSSRTIV